MILRSKNLLSVLCILLLAIILCFYFINDSTTSAAQPDAGENSAKKDRLQEQLAEELRDYYIYGDNINECRKLLQQLADLE